jgi:hypothetical protein
MTSAAPAYHRFSAASKWHAGAALDMPYINVNYGDSSNENSR